MKRRKILSWLVPIARDSYSKLSFAWVGQAFHSRLQQFGASGQKIPTLVILDGSKFFPFDETLEFDSDNVAKHVSSFLDGGIKAHFKSEPIPETNDEPVKVVVGNSFKDIVLDPTKDVLVEFYAPWCGHCKTLVPIYNELGEHFKDSTTVVIAKMDATANDNPSVEISGFPTIYFFPAGDKSQPLSFEGDRTVEGFVSFIEEHTGADHTQKVKDEL